MIHHESSFKATRQHRAELKLYSQKETNELRLLCLDSLSNIDVQIYIFAQASLGIFWEVLAGWQHDEMRGNMRW